MKKRLLGLVAIPLIAIGSLTYAENDLIVHDTTGGTITVYGTGADGKIYGITIQDKNLGAENVGDTGYYFQWGNNHGNYAGTNTGNLNELLDADVNERVNKGYSGENDKFIIFNNVSNKNTYDYRSGVYYTNATDNSYVGDSVYNNLRGGGNDNQTGDTTIVKGYDTVKHVATNVTGRQGPCPEGYHVPSAGEWQELLKLYANAKGYTLNTHISAWANTISQGNDFSNDFQLLHGPGFRNFAIGSLDAGGAFYRSSTPFTKDDPRSAYFLYFYTSYVTPSSNNARGNGLLVRCFKNSYVKLPKTLNLFFMSDGEEVGTGEVTENMTGAVSEEAKNVSMTGYELFWIRSGATTTGIFDFETTPISGAWADESGNVYFIAQWTGIKYEIKFEAGDGTGTMENQTFIYDITGTLTPNAFTKTGYTFSGWTDGTTGYTDGQEVVNLTTTGGEVIILTAQWTKIETKPSGGSSGGGGRSSKTSDKDKDTTNNPSVTDVTAPLESGAQGDSNDGSPLSRGDTASAERGSTQNYTQEFQEAYEFAHEKGITTMPTIQEAQMNGKLTRIAMAKMLSQYAMNILGQKPANIVTPKFNDVTDKQNSDYDDGVTLAYQLGIMGQNMPNNKFRPNDEVTRAEFATALSRMLYHTSDGEYKSTDKYYTNHMKKLVQEKIITNDDAKMKELRGYVMIMLMRSAK